MWISMKTMPTECRQITSAVHHGVSANLFQNLFSISIHLYIIDDIVFFHGKNSFGNLKRFWYDFQKFFELI